MKSLVSILESYDINESFKSQTLRDLMNILDTEVFKQEGHIKLPRGIAWDKIEDKDVFYGETGDESFFKNFVNKKDYICIWYPVIKKSIYTKSRSHQYLAPGRFIITTGNYFIQSPGNDGTWNLKPSALTSDFFDQRQERAKLIGGEKEENETYWEYRQRTNNAYPGDRTVSRSSKVPGREYNPVGFKNVSVKNIFDLAICSIIAISKTAIAANDTSELINARYKSKIGATALMLEPISDQDKRGEKINYYTKVSYNLKASDYPAIRKTNMDRYEKIVKINRYKYKGLELLKKYEPVMKDCIKYIDKYSKEVRSVPEYIKMISDEDFINTYFNHTKGGSDFISRRVGELQDNYDTIVRDIDKIIMYYKSGYKTTDYDIKRKLDEIDMASVNIKNIISTLDANESV